MANATRLLVGVERNPHGDEAVRQAGAWAEAHEWELLACHVIEAPVGVATFPRVAAGADLARPELVLQVGSTLREQVASLTGRDPARLRVLVETGDPAAELVRDAEEERVRLLVVGRHAPAAHLDLTGDVAERVVRHAHCSVLVARPHRETKRILVATDLSPAARGALALAADHARRVDAQLTLACSVERRMEPVWIMAAFGATHGFVESEYADVRREVEAQLEAELRAVGARGDIAVLDGRPAAAIARAAEERDADLVVLGASGASRLRRALLGRVAEQVLRAAPCSVLVARGVSV